MDISTQRIQAKRSNWSVPPGASPKSGYLRSRCAVLLLLTQNLWLRWLGEYLVYTTTPCKADMIVVLAGDAEGNRIRKAGDLQRAGWAPIVLVSGAGHSYGFNEGELAIQFATRAGYPASAFFNLPTPHAPQRTRRGISSRKCAVAASIVFSSSPAITIPTGLADIYRKAAPDIPFCVAAAPDPDFRADGWWQTREGRKTAFFEWCKTIAHFFHI